METTAATQTPLEEFSASAVDTLDDPRGRALGGSLDFRLVDDGGLFTVVLASPDEVEQAALVCSAEWSCPVGDRVLMNNSVGPRARWLPVPLEDYLGGDRNRDASANLRAVRRDAGFAAVEVLPIEHDFFRFYRLTF